MKGPALTCALLACAILLAACARLTPPATATIMAPAAPTPSLGLSLASPAPLAATVELPPLTITLVGLGLPAGFPVVTPDTGHQFVAPQLTVVCQLPADAECRALSPFELIDAQGTRHSPAIAVTGEGFLAKAAFGGGTAVTGGLVFMVPIEAAPYVLRYVGEQGREAFFVVE